MQNLTLDSARRRMIGGRGARPGRSAVVSFTGRAVVALSAVLLGLACSDSEAVPDGASSTEGNSDDVTWYAHIAPLMETHCTSCHLPGGQGVGDFTDPAVVRDFGPAITASVAAGRMPPPASDPECRDYIGADRWVVPGDFNERVQNWLDAGAPAGDPESYVPVPPIEMALADPDLEVRIPAPYRPAFSDPANPGNEYRCFVVEHGREEPFYIRGMAPVIDRTELVHHIVLFKARRADIPAINDPVTGYDCIDMTFFVGSGGIDDLVTADSGMISAWAPGSQAVRFPEGAGIRMEPDHVFIVQMHYFDGSGGEPQPDLSGYAFHTTPEAETEILMAPIGPSGFRIPAGASDHEESFTVQLPFNVTLFGVMPHMHYLGRSYRMWYERRGEDTCIVESDRYDFDNQLTYMFADPVRIPFGSRIGFKCTWDNSTGNPNLFHNPPVDIRYGERTDQEMCYGFALIALR